MANTLKIDHTNRKLIMDALFAKKSAIVGSREYESLKECHQSFPNYVITTKEIRRNPKKKTYKGLTYEYMESYITMFEPLETRRAVLKEFAEMRIRAACHSDAFRYPVIKNWFLNKYPELMNFGLPEFQSDSETNSNLAPISEFVAAS